MDLIFYDIMYKNENIGEAIQYPDDILVVKYYDYRFPDIYHDLDALLSFLGQDYTLVKNKILCDTE